MAKIESFLPIVLKAEGGFVNDPSDRGGATNKGITLATYQSFFGKSKSVNDLKRISDEEVKTIYKQGYWDKVHGDNIYSQSVANLIADFAVNSGVSRATRTLQNILGLTADGKFGPITLSAVNTANSRLLFDKLKSARRAYYKAIVSYNPSQAKFLNGWNRRLDLYTYIE